MPNAFRKFLVGATIGVLGATTGCKEFLTVDNPNVVNNDAIDPVRDARTLSLSARENFFLAAGWHSVFSSFLVWETYPAETFPEYSQFGLRQIVDTNGPLNTNNWALISQSVVTNDQVVKVLAGSQGEATNVNIARSSLFGGYALVLMGETFCQGVINGGAALTTAQTLDSAIVRFTKAITVAGAITTGADAAEATAIRNAALVGRARAKLQRGLKAEAKIDADAVATGFNFNMTYVDNIANRARLSNRMWLTTNDRRTIVVPPYFRVTDPRVPFIPPATPTTLAADGIMPFFAQNKYKGYDSPVRLASKIEADYISAEAAGTQAMLALIQARRAANGLAAYAGATDDASVLKEFEDQRGYEFYLEGKRLGDFRRNGNAVGGVPAPGVTYFKSGFTPVGDQTCFPVPYIETSNNPNFTQ